MTTWWLSVGFVGRLLCTPDVPYVIICDQLFELFYQVRFHSVGVIILGTLFALQ